MAKRKARARKPVVKKLTRTQCKENEFYLTVKDLSTFEIGRRSYARISMIAQLSSTLQDLLEQVKATRADIVQNALEA